jgi:hypothetical protein
MGWRVVRQPVKKTRSRAKAEVRMIFFISVFNFHVKTIQRQSLKEIVSINDMKMAMNLKLLLIS